MGIPIRIGKKRRRNVCDIVVGAHQVLIKKNIGTEKLVGFHQAI